MTPIYDISHWIPSVPTCLKPPGNGCIEYRRSNSYPRNLADSSSIQSHETTRTSLMGRSRGLYFSWVHRLCATGCGCCPNDPSTYSLRQNHLEIKTVNPCRFGPIACCSCCCGPKYEIDSVNLSQITDADVKGVPPNCIAQTCCCGETQEHVVITTKAEGAKILRLKKNEGQQVARRIKNQVETMQVMERS